MVNMDNPIPDDEWRTIVANVPLVSVDLVIEYDGGVLLGKRENEPAKGEWFVRMGRCSKTNLALRLFTAWQKMNSVSPSSSTIVSVPMSTSTRRPMSTVSIRNTTSRPPIAVTSNGRS